MTDEEKRKFCIVATVKLAFKKAGYEFEKPSKEAIVSVVADLAQDSKRMGMPESIVKHHLNEFQKVVDRLK